MKILWYRVFLKFENMTTNVYILVLNRFLALITYWTNLVLPLVLQCNIVRQLVLLHYKKSYISLSIPTIKY